MASILAMNTILCINSSSFTSGDRQRAGRRHGTRGFTLVELVATLAVMAVTLAVGIPSLKDMIHSIKINSVVNGFVSHLYMARAEAIKRNSRVVVCKSPDGSTCATSGGWDQGWIVFHDANNDGLRGADEPVLAHEHAVPSTLRLTGNLNVVNYISFASTGATRLVGGGFQAGTLTLCRESAPGGEGRQIILNAVGRPRVQKVATCG